ncbi:MAG: leucine-rich repeat domain-containing protein [Lachnospiraceae bacterium]|nr:leucine-rich repeat domain-containing protein [Lachnospiraceae bacterium]
MEREITLPEGSIIFDESRDGLSLVRISGNFTELTVPEKPFDDKAVTSVSKKAFLGKRTIKKIRLPETVKFLGDWCFANCINLTEVWIPSCKAGEGIFLGCTHLEEIMLPGITADYGAIVAGAVRYGAPPHLCDISVVETDRFEKWDSWVKLLLEEPDDEGFTNQILCGEEDYGSTDKEAYESRRRVMKASVCMLRLLHPEMLSDDRKKIMTDYLYRHREGSPDGNETWIALRDLFPDKRHFDLLSSIDCIDDDNRDIMIRSLKDDRQELKSLLMKSAGSGAADRFFASLQL